MFHPRRIESDVAWLDADGIKIYTISAHGGVVDQEPYLVRLAEVKVGKEVDWSATPAFVIFHDGANMPYFVLAWWGNDNELFTLVSARTASGWIESPSRHSFCVYDLEVLWQERNFFIAHIDCPQPDIDAYRSARFSRR